MVPSHRSGEVYSVSLSAQTTGTQREIEMEREREKERKRTNKCGKERKCTTVGTVWERRRGIIWRIKLKTPSSFLSATLLKLCRGERQRRPCSVFTFSLSPKGKTVINVMAVNKGSRFRCQSFHSLPLSLSAPFHRWPISINHKCLGFFIYPFLLCWGCKNKTINLNLTEIVTFVITQIAYKFVCPIN